VISTIAAILILSLVLMAIPVHLVLALHKDEAWRGRVVVYWLFGLIRIRMRRGRTKKHRRQLRKSVSWMVKQRRYLHPILRSDGVVKRIVILFKDLFSALGPRRLRLRWVVGLNDPADTGRLMGLIAPLLVVARTMSPGQDSKQAVHVTPDFSGSRFTGQCCVSVQFIPLRLIGIFLGFLLSWSVWRGVRASIRSQKAQTH